MSQVGFNWPDEGRFKVSKKLCFELPKLTLHMCMFGLRISSNAFWHTNFLYGFPIDKRRQTDIHIFRYHAKS